MRSGISLMRHQHISSVIYNTHEMEGWSRQNHSTTTALSCSTHEIAKGMNEPKPCSRTVLVALDLSRAFDTVSIPLLLRVILGSSMSPVIKRWLCGYLRGRQSYVEFRGAISRYRKVTQGDPHGGVLSPTLVNAYMAGLPIPPVDIKLFSYADDVTALVTAKPPLKPVYDRMSEYLTILSNWLKCRHMGLSVEKSSTTLFMTNTKELNELIQIFIDSNIIPTVKRPKILGVVFDGLLTFAHHCHHVPVEGADEE